MDTPLEDSRQDDRVKKDVMSLTISVSSPLLAYKDPEKNVKGSTWYATVVLLVNTCIGAGMLNMASAFNKAGGLPVGITAQIFLSILLGVSMVILCYCSDIHMSNTFQDVVYSLCGKKAMLASSIAAVVYAFGLVVTFMIVIGDQLDIFLLFTYGKTYCLHWYLSRPFTMCTTICLLVLPLCYPTRIDFLKYASFIGFVAIYYLVVFMIVRYCITDYPNKGPIRWGPSSFLNIFGVVPTALFGYQCHLSIVPIYSCMEKRNMKELMKVMCLTMPLIIFAFTSSGTVGYLTFGSHVNQDVLLSYRPVTVDVLVATILIAAKMYTDAPILTFVGRTAVDSIYCYIRQLPEQDIVKYEKKRRIVIASIWFVVALVLSVVLPHIGTVISLMGALAALFSILIPGVCLLQSLLQGHVVLKDKVNQRRVIILISSFYIVFGTFIFVMIFLNAIMVDVIGGTPASRNPPKNLNYTCT